MLDSLDQPHDPDCDRLWNERRHPNSGRCPRQSLISGS